MKCPTILTLTLTLTVALAVPLAFAQTAPATAASSPTGCASVEIHNVRPQQGMLMVAAYGSAESFGRKPLTALRVPAGGATMRVQLCGLGAEPGAEVALMLFQDLDSDGKMGRNLVGLPTEPWGSSGSPGSFGPDWSTGKVRLDGSAIAVKMSL